MYLFYIYLTNKRDLLNLIKIDTKEDIYETKHWVEYYELFKDKGCFRRLFCIIQFVYLIIFAKFTGIRIVY